MCLGIAELSAVGTQDKGTVWLSMTLTPTMHLRPTRSLARCPPTAKQYDQLGFIQYNLLIEQIRTAIARGSSFVFANLE